ncbi:hypothetical protein [Phormidium tenue]|uniref:Uncharacterized protein n=1 Tax=Phormidium tenue FACHB-1050 TaxID=2692857 RepID=A0ABR8CIC6_9CYAN|nr:hypothetical protein [Phormidium tenue]MBD2320053.1 hypothetical protein [Phormidium tenue FACHB-1050]
MTLGSYQLADDCLSLGDQFDHQHYEKFLLAARSLLRENFQQHYQAERSMLPHYEHIL